MKIEIKKFFHFLWREKHSKTRVDCLFFDFENLLRLFQKWEKCKNYRNDCYSCYKAPCQVWNYKIVEKKSYDSFLYHLVLDSISAFRLRPKTHMRSAVLCRSLNNSIWFRFDWNVLFSFQYVTETYYFVWLKRTISFDWNVLFRFNT